MTLVAMLALGSLLVFQGIHHHQSLVEQEECPWYNISIASVVPVSIVVLQLSVLKLLTLNIPAANLGWVKPVYFVLGQLDLPPPHLI